MGGKPLRPRIPVLMALQQRAAELWAGRMAANIARGTSKIPVILCIDVEPDPHLVTRSAPEPWLGYESIERYLSDLRPRIEEVSGSPVHYCWFFRMDPQVAESYGTATWVVDRYEGVVARHEGAGDELAIHTHAYRWLESAQAWVRDFANQDWIDHCVGTSLEAFARAFGRRCVSFRFGDQWLNTATVNLAEGLGVRFDLTIEPGLPARPWRVPDELVTGRLPDFRRVPRIPYWPSESDFGRPRRRGTRSIRLIPLSSSYLRGQGLRVRARRWLANGWRGRLQDTPLWPWAHWHGVNTFERMLDRALAVQPRPYLAFAIRSDAAVHPEMWPRVKECLRALLAHPAGRRFVFCTSEEALSLLDGTTVEKPPAGTSEHVLT